MPVPISVLASYVPSLIARRFAKDSSSAIHPSAERFPAAVLLADISGFTPLTEQLAQRGAAGAEVLSELLNSYFGKILKLVNSHGGDILKFEGDALRIIWPAITESQSIATHRAAQCALDLQDQFNPFQAVAGVNLQLKIGVGAGEVLLANVGGVKDQWLYLVAGKALVGMNQAEKHANPGEVVLSVEGSKLIGNLGSGRLLPHGCFLLEALAEPITPRALAPLHLQTAAEAALRGFISGAILSRLDAGQSDWLAEFRRLNVLFINVTGFDFDSPEVLARLQPAIQELQLCFNRYEGVILQTRVDGSGMTLATAFGLPPFTHEQDAVRAVNAATLVASKLRQMGLQCMIGITSGEAFCGPVGNELRREYTLHGDIVNLACRLMQTKTGSHLNPVGNILCDAATYQAARSHLSFEKLPPFVLKGKIQPVEVYLPYDLSKTIVLMQHLVGREAEQKTIKNLIAVLQKGTSSVLLIEGEPGIGKSCLLKYLNKQVHKNRLLVFQGAADEVEKATPYFAWRPIFGALLRIQPHATTSMRGSQVLALLHAEPGILRLAPLLNTALGMSLKENQTTAQMTGQVRADNTNALLLRILRSFTNRAPLVLILEDAHWIDSASWNLARRISEELNPVLLVLAARPMEEPVPEDCRVIMQSSKAMRMKLRLLSKEESLALTCQRLGAPKVSEPISNFIYARSEGNPFFIEELAYAMRDTGLIVIDRGECRLAPGVKNLDKVRFSESIQGVVTSRIDQLKPEQQLVLKVASVIGRVFAYRILNDAYPVQSDKPHLKGYLDRTARLDLTMRIAPEPNLEYIFKHVITREIAYNTMLFAQRQQLHKSIAEWYENNYPQELEPYYALLAHHWRAALGTEFQNNEVTHKTITYFEKAGEQALLSYANKEAVLFLNETLSLGTNAKAQIGGLRKVKWQRELGEAHYRMGNLPESCLQLEKALELLGEKKPSQHRGLLLRLCGQVALQFLHRVLPSVFAKGFIKSRQVSAEAISIYKLLSEVFVFTNDKFPLCYTLVRTLNLAEALNHVEEVAWANAGVCYMYGLMGLHRLANAHCDKALSYTEKSENAYSRASVQMIIGLYCNGIGNWLEAGHVLEPAIRNFESLGDCRNWEQTTACLANSLCYQGEFTQSEKLWNEVIASAKRRGDSQSHSWGLTSLGEIKLRLGGIANVEEAVSLFEESASILATNIARADESAALGGIALARFCQGRFDLARQTADRVSELISKSPPSGHWLLLSYSSVAEVYLRLLEAIADQPSAERKVLEVSAHRICQTLSKHFRVFPIWEPSALLWQGLFEWLTGKPKNAQRTWAKSLARADHLGMPYEQAMVHYEIGRHLPSSDSTRQLHFYHAEEIFQQLGVTGSSEGFITVSALM